MRSGRLDYETGKWVDDPAPVTVPQPPTMPALVAPSPTDPALLTPPVSVQNPPTTAADKARLILQRFPSSAAAQPPIPLAPTAAPVIKPDNGVAIRGSDIGLASPTALLGNHKGMVKPGNIDLTNRPDRANEDGSHSSIRSMSFSDGGPEILVPTIADDGRRMTDDEAIGQYRKTGKHLGHFDTPDNATAYGSKLHEQQAGDLNTAIMAEPMTAADKARALIQQRQGRQ